MMYTTFRFELGADGVALITLDLPNSSANVMSEAFGADMKAVVERIAGDAAIKGAVITSAKADFMAGGDLKFMVERFSQPMSTEQAFAIATSFGPTLRRLETSGKPFAAAINGPAMGGGLELALACHYRVAADAAAVVLALPEATLGLMPGAGGTQRLPRLIGVANALPIMLTGKRLDAAAALKAGVVNEVRPPADIVAAARRWIVEEGDPQQPWDKKGFKVPGGAGFFDVELGQVFNVSATQIARDTAKNLPAPITLLSAVARGTAVSMDAGLHIESCGFAKLAMNPVARNIARAMFVSKGELDKVHAGPRGCHR